MNTISDILEQSIRELENTENLNDLAHIRVKYVGKKGIFTSELKKLSTLSSKERPKAGEKINSAKADFLKVFTASQSKLEKKALESSLKTGSIDVTLDGYQPTKGGRHPISLIKSRIEKIFTNSGYKVKTGPEIEDDYHNFTALNIPTNHPARAMHDTFYLGGDKLLRTHTSPVQIRSLLSDGVPIRIIAPGRVYRCDSDQTHTQIGRASCRERV